MEKKTIFLELPCELIDEIDRINTFGDRSTFVSCLLEKQVKESKMIKSNNSITRIGKTEIP